MSLAFITVVAGIPCVGDRIEVQESAKPFLHAAGYVHVSEIHVAAIRAQLAAHPAPAMPDTEEP